MSLILGIDPSLNGTGLAVIKFYTADKFDLLHHQVVEAKSGGEVISKINNIIDQILTVVEKYKVESIAIEETIVNKNAGSSLKLGLVRGACLAAAHFKKIPISEYNPRSVKLSICGNGGAAKEQVKYIVSLMIKTSSPADYTKISLDETDAIAIAITHYYHLKK